MALEFDLSISTILEPMQALQILSKKLNFEWDLDRSLIGGGICVSAIHKTALGQSIIEEGFSFKPTITVAVSD